MSKRIYMCNDCYNNKKHVTEIFDSCFGDPDSCKDYCFQCKGHNMTQLNLDQDEALVLMKTSKDPDFILAMDKLKGEDLIEFNLKMAQFKQSLPQTTETDNTPKCPTCGSTNIKKISGGKRWLTTGIFGLASSDVGKNMQCNSCGYKF